MKHKKIVVIGLALIILATLIYFSGIVDYLSLENIKAHRDALFALTQRNYLFSVIAYLVIFMAIIACAIPAVGPMGMLGGFLFGVLPGVLYGTIGACTGSTISFLLLRRMIGRIEKSSHAKTVEQLSQKLKKHGSSYLLVLQFLVVVPFLVINMVAAVAHIPLKTFLWTTIVGFLPSAFLYAYAGKQLATIESVSDLFSWPVVIMLMLLIGIALMPLITQRIQGRSK